MVADFRWEYERAISTKQHTAAAFTLTDRISSASEMAKPLVNKLNNFFTEHVMSLQLNAFEASSAEQAG